MSITCAKLQGAQVIPSAMVQHDEAEILALIIGYYFSWMTTICCKVSHT